MVRPMVPTAKEPPAVAGPSTPAPEARRPLAGRRRRSEALPVAPPNPLAVPPVGPVRRIAEVTEVTRAALTVTARRIPTGREGEEAQALGAEEAAVLAAPRINSALGAALAEAIAVAVGAIAAAVVVIEGPVEVWVVIGVVVVTVAAVVPVVAGETTVTVEVTAVITGVITALTTSTVTEKKKAMIKV